MSENKTANKNTNTVFDYYVKYLLSKLGNIEDLANEIICLFCMGNTKFIKYVKSICKSVIVIDEFCFSDTIYDCKAFKYINNIEAINTIFKQIEENMGVKIKYIVMNPPFSLGNEIVNAVKEYLTDDGKAVVIQPLNEYKKQNLFEHIETFELADPTVFNDAVITENLNISIVTKKKQNKFTWQELVLESCDQNFRKFYDWNIAHDCGIVMSQKNGKTAADFDINLDFVESGRAFSKASGAGFGINGIGYKWNNNLDIGDNWLFNTCWARFISKKAKQNFVKYWYNGKKGKSLSSKAILGLHATNASGVSYCIPQIDWETIDQHPLWSTDVDAAVLDTMGLKWDSNKEKIILK
jgi:hypothetical protein